MPRYTRDSAHSSAAAGKLSKRRVGGSILILPDMGPALSTSRVSIVNVRRSPNVSPMTVMAALQTVPCADGYDGNAYVCRCRLFHCGSGSVAGLPSLSAQWIAVYGRQ